ncbi:MAG TPA: hypothetical protein VD994_05080 [Prosthecobacter sp.]|nr:hypothetical protein [Prosthecobacter sp.]
MSVSCVVSGAEEEATGLDVDLAKTFRFCEGNRFTLKQMHELLPALSPKVAAVEKRWNAAFGKAEANVEARLKSITGGEWPEIREALRNKVIEVLRRENEKSRSEKRALAYLELTERRIRGELDSPVREMLLASHPDFVAEPALEFSRGYTQSFETEGKENAKGVKLSLKLPASWKARETKAADAVQKWVSDAGYGFESVTLLVRDVSEIPAPPGGLFVEEFARKLVTDGGLEFKGFSSAEVAKKPLGTVHFRHVAEQEKPLTLRGSLHYFVHGDKFVELRLTCGTASGAENSEERIKRLQELMKLVVGSVVLG